MDVDEFRKRAETDQVMADYLDDVSQQAAPDQADRTFGVETLFFFSAYALYLWVRNYIDHQRGLQEAELRRLMEQEIDAFVKKGFSRQQAVEAVLAVSKAVSKKPPDDSVLKAGLAAMGKG
jgi:hypothetical protein